MARIVFDMDGTLVGFRRNGKLVLNAKLVRVAENLRAQGHTLVLWTFGNRNWWREVARQYPVLRQLFREVYTQDELPGHETRSPMDFFGHRVTFPRRVKDIRVIRGDVLIDNDESHHQWARRHGLADRYILVPTFGTA
jgi:phosphoserine phosphatase